MIKYMLVFIGGGLGSVARMGISMLVLQVSRPVFPMATLTANFLSCLVAGGVLAWAGEKAGDGMPLRWLLITGFCGGFSTFSAFGLETVELIRNGHIMYAGLNVAISLLACLGVIYFIQRSFAP